MKTLLMVPLTLCVLPLSAQAWDLRLEAPFAQGQDLPRTTLQTPGQSAAGSLDTGHGVIFTVSHRIVRVGPVLKFEWNAEYAQLQADGRIQQGQATLSSRLRQSGFGAGVNAQFWMPFTGFAGELGLLGRVHSYRYEGAGAVRDETIARPWLRAGLRWVLPFPGISPYLAASYQQPLTRDKPAQQGSARDMDAYLGAQGAGQEFQRLWTVGLGISF
ncbi:MAG: hypothetical protein P4L36_19100 [Holophaga sp.]|nr:hypothetical protein [Holophaga sp.]